MIQGQKKRNHSSKDGLKQMLRMSVGPDRGSGAEDGGDEVRAHTEEEFGSVGEEGVSWSDDSAPGN